MNATAPGTPPVKAVQLQDAAAALAVAAAGADALARVLLLASVAPHLVEMRAIRPHELDALVAETERLHDALDTFTSRAGQQLSDRLRERIDWAEGKARHDRTEAICAARGGSSAT